MLHFKLKRGSYRGRGRLVHRHGSQTTKKTNYGSRDNDNQHALKHSLDPVLTLEKVAKRCLKTQQRGDGFRTFEDSMMKSRESVT